MSLLLYAYCAARRSWERSILGVSHKEKLRNEEIV